MESFDFRPALGHKGGVLSDRVRVIAINPKDGVVHTVTDAVRTHTLWNLHNPAQAESTESRIVEDRGTSDVSNPDAGMVNHGTFPRRPDIGHGSAQAGIRISSSSQRTMLGNVSSGISASRQSVAIEAS